MLFAIVPLNALPGYTDIAGNYYSGAPAEGAVNVTDSYYVYPSDGSSMNGFSLDTRYGGGAGTTGFAGGATPLADAGYSGMPLQLVEIK